MRSVLFADESGQMFCMSGSLVVLSQKQYVYHHDQILSCLTSGPSELLLHLPGMRAICIELSMLSHYILVIPINILTSLH